MTVFLRGLVGDGSTSSSPGTIAEAYAPNARTPNDDLSSILLFRAGATQDNKPQTSKLSDPLRKAFYCGLAEEMEFPPLMLGVGEGFRAPFKNGETPEHIRLAICVAREANTLALHCVSRTFWQCVSATREESNDQEVTFEYALHHDRWFTRATLHCRIGEDDPISANFYLFADLDPMGKTVEDCLRCILQHLEREPHASPLPNGFSSNFLL